MLFLTNVRDIIYNSITVCKEGFALDITGLGKTQTKAQMSGTETGMGGNSDSATDPKTSFFFRGEGGGVLVPIIYCMASRMLGALGYAFMLSPFLLC